jgi:hypothetical protein
MESSRVFSELQVSDDGLRVAAGWREALAAELASNCMPTAVGSTWLASAVTVNASHAQVAAAGVRCTLHAQATATKLGRAATAYAANEASSASQLRALDRPTVC